MAEFLQQCGSWGVLATLAAYAAGVWVNRKTGKALFNPLLMGSIFMIVFLSCFGVPYADYKSSAQPVSWLLMPATVSLAIPLYEKWELLEKNLAAIFASIAAGVLTSLGSVLAMAWVLKLDQVRETGLFLTGIFPLLFVPAAAGVVELGSQLMDLLLPAVLAIVPITALVMAVTGMVAQKCAGRKEHKNG